MTMPALLPRSCSAALFPFPSHPSAPPMGRRLDFALAVIMAALGHAPLPHVARSATAALRH